MNRIEARDERYLQMKYKQNFSARYIVLEVTTNTKVMKTAENSTEEIDELILTFEAEQLAGPEDEDEDDDDEDDDFPAREDLEYNGDDPGLDQDDDDDDPGLNTGVEEEDFY